MEGRRPKCYSPTIYKLAWRLAQVEYIYIIFSNYYIVQLYYDLLLLLFLLLQSVLLLLFIIFIN